MSSLFLWHKFRPALGIIWQQNYINKKHKGSGQFNVVFQKKKLLHCFSQVIVLSKWLQGWVSMHSCKEIKGAGDYVQVKISPYCLLFV